MGDHFLIFVPSHSQNSKAFTEGPATQKVDLKIMVEKNNRVLLSIQRIAFWVGVKCAFRARPPLQDCNYLCDTQMHFHENRHVGYLIIWKDRFGQKKEDRMYHDKRDREYSRLAMQ